MTIPSYDDLTPGIPDEVDAKSVDQLALFLRQDLTGTARVGAVREPPTVREPSMEQGVCRRAVLEPPLLFACLRTANHEPPAFAKATAGQANREPRTANFELRTANDKLQTANYKLQTLLAVARDFSPRVMVVSQHEVLLDVSGLGRLIGEPSEIERQLARAISDAGLAARVAIATTQTMARLLAAARPERSGPRDSIADLAVTALQPLETLPPAMNHRDRARPYETLQSWGIATLGDLVALPAAELSSRLGRRGVALQRLARGLDPRPFVPDGETPRYIGRLELEWPLDTLEPLSFVFARLLEPLSAALERADRGAAAIRLDLRLTNRETLTRVLQLPAPMRDPKVLRTLLLLDLESPPSPLRGFPPSPANAGFGGTGGETSAVTVTVTVAVDAVSIELDPAPARITQFSLLERALPSPETLSTLTARLSALVGESRIGSAVLVDTHQPGAFAMVRYMPDLKVGPTGGGPTGGGPTGDGPTGGLILRRHRIPPAIRVSVEHRRPVYIAAARRGMPQGAVTQAAGPWRTSGGWWTTPPGAGGWGPGHGAGVETGAGGWGPSQGAAGWNRDEWDVALVSGAVCRIFQNRTTGCWFLEGTYD
jgi:protein ImuB